MPLLSIFGIEVVVAVLAFITAALTYTPTPGPPAERGGAAPDLAVGAAIHADLSSIQASADHPIDAALIGMDRLRLDLIGHRGQNFSPGKAIRRGALVGNDASERSIAGVAAARARIIELSHLEVATTLADALLGVDAAHSTGPPFTPHS